MKLGKGVFRVIAIAGQFGFVMLTPILMLFWVGYRLDLWLGTQFLSIILFFLGALVGMMNVHALVKSMDKGKDDGRS